MTINELHARTLLAIRVGDRFMDWLRQEYTIPFSSKEHLDWVVSADKLGRPVINLTYTIPKRIICVEVHFNPEDDLLKVREVTARIDGLNVAFSCLATLTDGGINLKTDAIAGDDSLSDKCSCGRKACGTSATGNSVCWHWPHCQTFGATAPLVRRTRPGHCVCGELSTGVNSFGEEACLEWPGCCTD